MDLIKEILRAERRISKYLEPTPLQLSPSLSEIADCNVYLKLENLQPTGSFKVRGALNKLLTLSAEERERGIIAASSGNHGAAVAFGLRTLGMHGTIFVPENASPVKVEAIKEYGAEVRHHATDVAITEAYARSYAADNGQTYISPYNDLQVIGGQGTIATELARQLDKADAIFVAVGGGGMISGVACYAKSVYDDVQVIGCLPQNSPVMAESVSAGHIVEMESLSSLSDGTAGGIERGSITFELCQQFVDEFVLPSEDEIAAAMRVFMQTNKMVIEGAAALPVAGLLKMKDRFRGKYVVVVIGGANVTLEIIKSIL